MLGQSYKFFVDCCPTYVSKQQLCEIQVQGGIQQQPSMGGFAPQGGQPLTNGRFFRSAYYKFCCGQIPVCLDHLATEVEMNGQIVTETEYSCLCPCLGPYQVRSGAGPSLGELEPKCYIEKCCPWTQFCTCCAELKVKDATMNHVYTVKRENCTCFCCVAWDIQGLQGGSGKIKSSGCPCYPEI